MTCKKSDRISHTYISAKMFRFIKNLFTCVQAIEILMCDKLVWVKNSKSAKRILHLCPNVKNSVEFITPAWGIRSVRNTVQHSQMREKDIPKDRIYVMQNIYLFLKAHSRHEVFVLQRSAEDFMRGVLSDVYAIFIFLFFIYLFFYMYFLNFKYKDILWVLVRIASTYQKKKKNNT